MGCQPAMIADHGMMADGHVAPQRDVVAQPWAPGSMPTLSRMMQFSPIVSQSPTKARELT